MNDSTILNEFNTCFSQLNEGNKQYILAISQALLFAQKASKNRTPDKDKIRTPDKDKIIMTETCKDSDII